MDSVRSLSDLSTDAHAAYAARNYAACEALCLSIARLDPTDARNLLLLGAAYFQLRDFNECLRYTYDAIKLTQAAPMPEAFSNVGNALKELGDTTGAQTYYHEALRLRPTFADAHGNLGSMYLQQGFNKEAIYHFRQALATQPRNACWLVDLGHLLRQSGCIAEAKDMFLRAIQVDPGFAIAWSNLACVNKDEKDVPAAVEHYKHAIALDPTLHDAYSNLGNVLKDSGALDEAETMYSKALSLRPSNPIVTGNLAAVYLEQGRVDEALHSFEAALAVMPDFPDCLSNMGNALKLVGRLDDALAAYHRCLELTNWTHCDGLNNAANAYKDKGDSVTAEKLYRKAIALRPHFSGARSNLGNLLKEQFKLTEALAEYEAAIRADPQFADAWSNMGNCLKDMGRFDDAIKAYTTAIGIRPTFADAYGNLASVYKDTGVLDKAIEFYRKALALRPGARDPIAFCNLVHCLQTVCDWTDRDDVFAQTRGVIAKQMNEGAVPAVQPHHALVYPLPAEQQLQLAAHYAAAARKNVSVMGLAPYDWPREVEAAKLDAPRRLRVGYVSSDLGNHPLSHLMQHVFVWHDRSRFEVFIYATSPDDGSEWRSTISRGVEHCRVVAHLPHAELAAVIYADQLDVLVNLNGYTKGSRNEVFSLCPAPVQVMYLGFPGSSGAAYMDYFVTDPVTTPPSLSRLFTERLAYMPHCYFVNDHMQSYLECAEELSTDAINAGRAAYGLPPRPAVVFCMHNQLYKIDPSIFASWMRILARVPGSVLWLLQFPATGQPHILDEARALGIPAERLVFTPVAVKVEHIKRGRLADLFLDTPLCNAHTTGTDILWAGVPLLTVPCLTLASRVAASLLHACGCPELVARDFGDYESIAVRLGTHIDELRSLQAKVRSCRWTQPLFDTRRWVADWQKLLVAMVRDYRTLCAAGVDPRAALAQRAAAALAMGDANACGVGTHGEALGKVPVQLADATPLAMFQAPAPIQFNPLWPGGVVCDASGDPRGAWAAMAGSSVTGSDESVVASGVHAGSPPARAVPGAAAVLAGKVGNAVVTPRGGANPPQVYSGRR